MLNDDKLSTDGHRAKPWATFLDFWNLDCYGNWGQVTLASYKMKSSMSRKGDCCDNTPTESFWGSMKVGRLYGRKFATRRQAMDEVIDWMTFYNHRRIHSTLGYVSPMQF